MHLRKSTGKGLHFITIGLENFTKEIDFIAVPMYNMFIILLLRKEKYYDAY